MNPAAYRRRQIRGRSTAGISGAIAASPDPHIKGPDHAPDQNPTALREATMFVNCDHCDGSGIIARRVSVYEHGCGVPHDDTDEQPCPECDGTGQREIVGAPNIIHIDWLVLDALTAEREARIREVAELREQKDAWINRLEAENERLRVVLKRIANQTFLDDPTRARHVARQALTKKCPTCGGIGVSENEPQGCVDCLGTCTI
jgi:hypothetical protein